LRTAEKELEKLRLERLFADAARLAAEPGDVFGVSYVGHRAPNGTSPADVRKLALDIRARMPAERPAAVAVIGSANGKASVVVALNDEARRWRLTAGELVRVAAATLGGNGGGKDDVAQGGGTNPDAAEEALRRVGETIGAIVTR